MRNRLLIALAAFVFVFTLIVMAIVGVLYFTQVSEENRAVVAVKEAGSAVESESTSGAGGIKKEDTKAAENAGTAVQGTAQTEEVKEKSLKIVAVGDILLGRSVKKKVEVQPTRYLYPFEKVADFLKTGDVIFGNLEEPITSSEKGLTDIKHQGKYVLKNDVEAMEGLKYAGFNLFSLANNHILDYYEKGLYDTIEILNKNNVAFTGAGKNLEEARKLTILEKNGVKIGMLAYTDMAYVTYKGDPPLTFLATDKRSGVAPTKMEYIKEDMLKARPLVDILIVSLHWGIEYTYEPTEKQVDMAHEIMDLGADILLGHHTHRFQSIEIYKGKPIIYSLGNFIFDQNNPENQQGFMMELGYKDNRLSYLAGTPFKIANVSQIVPQTGASAEEMINREIELCKKKNTESYLENDKIVFKINQ